MKLMEYKAKELFDTYGLSTMPSVVVDYDIEALSQSGIEYPVVVKAQVQIGGRGKAGGIRFADNEQQAIQHCTDMLGSDIKGLTIDRVMVVQRIDDFEEWYLSIVMDRTKRCPVIIFSTEGGMEIEETAKNTPEKVIKLALDPLVGVQGYHSYYLLSKSGESLLMMPELFSVLKNLYRLFCEYGCLLCEINPLAVTKDKKLLALDGKVDIDDSELYHLPDIMEFKKSLPTEPLVAKAEEYGFLYIPVDAEGDVVVMSNGSGMLMSCIDLISKGGMKVSAVLDLGGGATTDRICHAVNILQSTPNTKAVVINIFGGITRCDEVANGIANSISSNGIAKAASGCENVLFVVRMEGTNKDIGLSTINGIEAQNVKLITVDGLEQSVEALITESSCRKEY